MLKRLLNLVIGIAMFVSMPLMVVASENEISGVVVNTGDTICPEVTLEEQLSVLSEEQQEMFLKKLEESEKYQILESRSTVATWNDLDGFVMYAQETDYYCVVACVQSVMKYFLQNQFTASQNSIATDMGVTVNVGTSILNALNYLNTNQRVRTYILISAPTSSLGNMKTHFSYAIDYNIPPLFSAQTTLVDRWPFEFSGHCMCISGAKSDGAQYRVADPYMGRAYTNADPIYEQSAQLIYNAIKLRGSGYLY